MEKLTAPLQRIKCPSCKEVKTSSNFHKDKYSKTGFLHICKVCKREKVNSTGDLWTTPDDLKETMEMADGFAQPITKEEVDREKAIMLNGLVNKEPLPGCTPYMSDQIRTIVALRLGGKTIERTAAMLEIAPSTISMAKVKHPEAWRQAIQEHAETTLASTQGYMFIARNMLSEVAPLAIKTLERIMLSRNAKPGIKKDAAIGILKLLNVGGSKNDAIDEAAINAFRRSLDEPLKEIENPHVIKDEDFVDVEAEEVSDVS